MKGEQQYIQYSGSNPTTVTVHTHNMGESGKEKHKDSNMEESGKEKHKESTLTFSKNNT